MVWCVSPSNALRLNRMFINILTKGFTSFKFKDSDFKDFNCLHKVCTMHANMIWQKSSIPSNQTRMLLLVCIFVVIPEIVSQFSNIDSIIGLSQNHDYGNDSKTEADAQYSRCIKDTLEDVNGGFIFGPFYKFVIELSSVSLRCSPCRYSDRPQVTWIKLSFENKLIRLASDEQYTIKTDNTLVLKSVRDSDFGTYYCTIKDSVGYIWSLEVERFNDFDIMKARHSGEVAYNLPHIKITTRWEPWSECSKCDRTGKRHRIGYCFVEESPEIGLNPFKALQVYKEGLSCNLFLLLHPDVDPETIQDLTSKPTIAIGYCKISCDYFTIDPGIIFSGVHPKLHGIYKEEITMLSDEQYVRSLNASSNRKWIPQKPTKFEALVLILFLILQLYIIIHVCKNRKKAT